MRDLAFWIVLAFFGWCGLVAFLLLWLEAGSQADELWREAWDREIAERQARLRHPARSSVTRIPVDEDAAS